jgi:hypothetical protein
MTIVRIAEGRTVTVTRVIQEPGRYGCGICEREWFAMQPPTECGFCAFADDVDQAHELARAEAVEAVSPGSISADEQRALRAEPYRLVAGLRSYPRTSASRQRRSA